jgi:hypothetical protein
LSNPPFLRNFNFKYIYITRKKILYATPHLIQLLLFNLWMKGLWALNATFKILIVSQNIDAGNKSIEEKTLSFCKSLTNKSFVVLDTDCIGTCKSNHHGI